MAAFRHILGLIIIYTLMNLPIAVWMAYTYFCEIPARSWKQAELTERPSGKKFGTSYVR